MGSIVWAGSSPEDFGRDAVGGKGFNLLRLFNLAQQTGLFEVPNYFIIPSDAKKNYINTDNGTCAVYKGPEIRAAFERLRKPVAVRSSSPLEDGLNASFAGMFSSFLDVKSYDEMGLSANKVYKSAFQERAQRYSARRGVEFSDAMAIIVQEQVTGASERGIIQLEDQKAVTESTDREGRTFCNETEYKFLAEIYPEGYNLTTDPARKPRDWLAEGDYHYATYCAREAKKRLGLDGIVQVEFLLFPGKPPVFVQIRQLPSKKAHAEQLDMTIPEGAPYVESEVCNDVAGELALPAYVTASQSGMKRILIGTGQSFFLGLGDSDGRAERFEQNSRLAENHDFQQFKDLVILERLEGLDKVLPYYAILWERGNRLFGEYILVCDRLDDTFAEMSDVTTNKRGIITCLEAKKTSHAMTVARELGIMCMGVEGDMYNLEPKFFHQVETGDIVHMKSDGKRAVAYIEKKRAADPYGE